MYSWMHGFHAHSLWAWTLCQALKFSPLVAALYSAILWKAQNALEDLSRHFPTLQTGFSLLAKQEEWEAPQLEREDRGKWTEGVSSLQSQTSKAHSLCSLT